MRSNSKELIATGQRKESVTHEQRERKIHKETPMAPPYFMSILTISNSY